MEKRENMQTGGRDSTQKTHITSSIPEGNVNDTGVKNGIGIPATPGNSNKVSKNVRNNSYRHFSNERPIF